uniref:Glucokinase regulatory protein n=1 Tax=Petromyzon marinus TaxID=7757 RepID=A0AAJ7UA94_PETMA|nr:glucokinase regulatory protein [Petromyzon marinus]XP_032832607.1 glucokinase regulatory protein [Petromyzon marinus]
MAALEDLVPHTERANPRTHGLDTASPSQLVQLLQECDLEIFQRDDKATAAEEHMTLFGESTIRLMTDVAAQAKIILENPENNAIVLSGCGTSGRLAFLVAKSFNKLLQDCGRSPCYTYVIAGGDKALITSQEAQEDQPELGSQQLREVTMDKKMILFIGITCGLSAPFVAGQLDMCLADPGRFTAVLLGFNPLSLARTTKVEGWHSSFAQVAERIHSRSISTATSFLLNPLVGAEALTGSTRMKGGSATKVVLETVFLAAHTALNAGVAVSPSCVRECLLSYEAVHKTTYACSPSIAELVHRCGTSLQQAGHLYYLGWGTLGIVAMIDASECPPTFGADINDVRAFLHGGYQTLGIKEGDVSSKGQQFFLSHEDFKKNILPCLTDWDTVILIFTGDDDQLEVRCFAETIRARSPHISAIVHASSEQHLRGELESLFATIVKVTWPTISSHKMDHYLKIFHWELSTKWILNAASTGAHVAKGKVLHNFMVDLKVSNKKLFERALGILQKFTGQPRKECLKALLRCIYETEEISEETSNADISRHIQVIAHKEKVVPTAMVALLCDCSVTEARRLLSERRVIRDAIEHCLDLRRERTPIV